MIPSDSLVGHRRARAEWRWPLLALLLTPSLALAAPTRPCKPLPPARARAFARTSPPTAYRIDSSGRITLTLGTGRHVRTVRVCEVQAFFAAVRKFVTPKLLQRTPGHLLTKGWGRLLLDGHTVYDLADTVERSAEDDAVRFPLFVNMGFSHSKTEAIAVWVTPKPALRKALIAAKKGHGLLARDAKSASSLFR